MRRLAAVQPRVSPVFAAAAVLTAPACSVQHLDDAFLTPALENDALLFGLDVDDADFQEAEGASSAAAAAAPERAAESALAAENELLKLRARTLHLHSSSPLQRGS